MDVRLTGVSKSYGDVTALRPIDVTVADGEFVSVLGASGCGKSTLLRCLAGLEFPERGRISFGERVVFDAEARVMVAARERRLGMVFQDLALWPHLTVFENVAFPLRTRGQRKDVASRVGEALERVQLGAMERRFPHELSGGQQQRVAFARAIVAEPDLLLMDEPLSALDAALRVALRGELAQLTRALGLTTVYVTHDQEEAMSMSDRILVMSEGRLLQDSPPEELYRNPADSRVAEFVGRFNRMPSGAAPCPVAGVRPEWVSVGADGDGDGDIRLSGRVAARSYVGGRYELRCRIDGIEGDWTVYVPSAPPLGADVDLRVASADLIALEA